MIVTEQEGGQSNWAGFTVSATRLNEISEKSPIVIVCGVPFLNQNRLGNIALRLLTIGTSGGLFL